MEGVAQRQRAARRARWALVSLAVPVCALTLFGLSVTISDHLHGRFVVPRGAQWCSLRPGVASPGTAVAVLGPPSASGTDPTSHQGWSKWRFRGVEYDISWFPGNKRAQDLWSSVTAQWGTLPCAKERIDYTGWYQPTQPWLDPPDPAALQP